MSESRAPSSPCVDICALDLQDICIGCHRHADEIARWSQMSCQEKVDTLNRVREREIAHRL